MINISGSFTSWKYHFQLYVLSLENVSLPVGLSDDLPAQIWGVRSPLAAAGSKILYTVEWVSQIQGVPSWALPTKCRSLSPANPRTASVVGQVASELPEAKKWRSCTKFISTSLKCCSVYSERQAVLVRNRAPCDEGMWDGWRYGQLHAFLTSALKRGVSLTPRPLGPRERDFGIH
jgi:hypothetical protein